MDIWRQKNLKPFNALQKDNFIKFRWVLITGTLYSSRWWSSSSNHVREWKVFQCPDSIKGVYKKKLHFNNLQKKAEGSAEKIEDLTGTSGLNVTQAPVQWRLQMIMQVIFTTAYQQAR
jgi:hypothetical protein